MSLRWNSILCAGIFLCAIAFVAGILFLAGTSESTVKTTGSKPLVTKAKILSRTLEAKPLQETIEMQPTEPNMTVIGQTGGTLMYSGSNIEVDVTNPPLLIDLVVVPKTVTETKWFVNRSLTKKEEIVQVPVVSQASFANLSVIEMDTGKIIAREGFGRDDSTDQYRVIKVFQPGKYRVQLYGNNVAAKALVSMRTPGFAL